MKKLFLLGLAAASCASMANASDYVSGGSDTYKDGYAISVEWANLDLVGTPTWVSQGKRTGAGANDKFYVSNQDDNVFSVYGAKGLVTNISLPEGNVWPGCTADQAGHVIMRASKQKWPGTGAYGGCFYPNEAANFFYIIDSNTDQLLNNTPYNLDASGTGRVDAIGFVSGDFTSGSVPMMLAADGALGLIGLYDDSDNNAFVGESSAMVINPDFADTGVGKVGVLGTAQTYGTYDENDGYTQAAVYPNFAAPNGVDVMKEKGLTNAIQRYTYGPTPDDPDVFKWQPTQEFFITPQHGGLAGFVIFEINGIEYIAYPVAAASDALAISELKTTNTPVGDPELDKAVLIARHFASVNEETGAPAYGASLTAPMTMTTEAVEGDPNSIYIYTYCQFGAMMKYKFTADGNGGVDNITVADKDIDAPVEFFNLNGQRVVNPEGGIFIRKQGTKATKVIL